MRSGALPRFDCVELEVGDDEDEEEVENELAMKLDVLLLLLVRFAALLLAKNVEFIELLVRFGFSSLNRSLRRNELSFIILLNSALFILDISKLLGLVFAEEGALS